MVRKRTAVLGAIVLTAATAVAAARVGVGPSGSPKLGLHPERELGCPAADHLSGHMRPNSQSEDLAASPDEALAESLDRWYPGLPFDGVEFHRMEANSAGATVVVDGSAILKVSLAQVGEGWAATSLTGCSSSLAAHAKSFD